MTPAGKIIDIDAFKKKESGLKATGAVPRPEKEFWEKYWPTAALLLSLVVLLTIIVSPPRKHKVPVYAEGAIAQENIKSAEDILLEDKESTEKNRQAAYDAALDIFDFDSAQEARVAERVKNAFSIMYKGYADHVRQEHMDLMKERERLESESDVAPERLPAERLAHASKMVADFERSQEYTALVEQFGKTLGVELDEKSIAILRYYHFWPKIEESVTAAIHQPLFTGLVTMKKLLPRGAVKGLVMRDIATGSQRTVGSLSEIMDFTEAERSVRESVAGAITGDKANLRRAVVNIALALLKPNLTLNSKETTAAKEKAMAAVNPVFFQVQKGEMIIREGERVSPAHHAKLLQMSNMAKDKGWIGPVLGAALICAMLVALGALFIWRHHEEIWGSVKMQALAAALLAVHMALLDASAYLGGLTLQRLTDLTMHNLLLASPLVFGPLVVSMLFTVELTILFTVIASALTSLMYHDYPLAALLTLVGGLVCAFHVRQYNKRTTLLMVGLIVGLVNSFLALGVELASSRAIMAGEPYVMALAFSGGLISAILVSGAVPLIESLFPVVSDIKLLELTNLNHPLLRRMIMEAPGTYHHSIMVGNLAEEACKEIGANALLARAGALFHDIGKMKKSEYFVENQRAGVNPHDKLNPSMSTLVIVSHIRDGLELAKKHRLLPQISAMIPEHHGTQTIRWFYHKAKQAEDSNREEVREENYKYPGPIPSSRESACVAMADSIEAAAKATPDLTPQKIKDLVTSVINDKFVQGQLDNSHLTLHDLALIAESFTRTLNGIHHYRIQYPEKEKDTPA
ncbi:MAG: HDIG domain-containing protein, partial [Nitrospinota bacterium]|nr:HDIG domain-containing protein [Nitrospinota bacterium]